MKKASSGIALLFSIFLVGFLISVVLTLSLIFIPKIRLAGETKNSVSAIYSAESGVEWCLYTNRVDPSGSTAKPIMGNGATYTDQNGGALDGTDCQVSPATIIGSYRGVTRAYQINF